MSTNTMLTYDLHNATNEMHEKAREILVRVGFVREVSADGGGTVKLPETTFVGEFTDTVDELRKWALEQFQAARLNPKRVAVKKDSGFSAWSNA